MAEASFRICLVVEAAADARTVQMLVDRVLCERIRWYESEILDSLRSWQGIEPEVLFTKWTRAAALAREHRIQSLGKFDGQPGSHYAKRASTTLKLFAKFGMPSAVILVVDADDQPERRRGLEQARDGFGAAEQVVIGVANPEREAWVLAGFVTRDDQERQRLAVERQRLGFDPTAKPHQLGGHGNRDAKRAYANLVVDRERERECLTVPELAELSRRGQGAGLADFLAEVHERVVGLAARGPDSKP
ncbi:MAG: hypothetical protein AAGF11_48225 [Myxococcota bacterium]